MDNKGTGDPRELHYYFNGLRVGDISNNGTSDTDYATSIDIHRITVPGTGPFRNGSSTSTSYADFDQTYDPINGLNYESTASRYAVREGDTLESIALQLWGDASFWYMIADANSLSGSEALAAGMSLIIPTKVHNSHNNADTYKVYDPNEAIGDTSPTAAKPPKHNKCGAFGQILLVAIAVAVAYFTAGTFTAALGPVLGGAATGAAASVVSQGIGVATGIQSKFSWKGVALAAIAGGVAGGLDHLADLAQAGKIGGTLGKVGKFVGGSGFLNTAVRGALGNVLSQGISVATGLQKKFDWAGVAATGIGAGVAGQIPLPGRGALVSGMAAGIAGAAAERLITGDDFGDTLMASLPSIIGNAVGNLVADAIADSGKDSEANTPIRTARNSTSVRLPGQADVMTDYNPGPIVVTGRKMSIVQKFWYDITHPRQTLGRIFARGSKPGSFSTSELARSVAVTLRRARSTAVGVGNTIAASPAHPISQIVNPISEWFNGTDQAADYGSVSGLGYGRGEADLVTTTSAYRVASEAPPIAVTLGADAYLGYGASGSLGFSLDMKTGQFRGVTSGGAGPGYGGGIGLNFSNGERESGALTNINLTAAYGISGTIQAPLDLETGKIGQPSGGGIGLGLPGIKGAAAGFGPRAGVWVNGSIDYTSPATPALWDLSELDIMTGKGQ